MRGNRQIHLFGMPTNSVIVFAVALALLSSAFITSYHFHPDLDTRPDCAVCKSASDLSSGDKQDQPVLAPQEIVETLAVLPRFNPAYAVFEALLTNRAPPV